MARTSQNIEGGTSPTRQFERFGRWGEPTLDGGEQADIEILLQDTGIIRHRGKISATINNARQTLAIQAEFGSLAAYIWRFETRPEHRPDDLSWDNLRRLAQTDASIALSKDLRKRGFKFVGPTTCYAFMQAMGLVNDHMDGCFCRDEVEAERNALVRPA